MSMIMTLLAASGADDSSTFAEVMSAAGVVLSASIGGLVTLKNSRDKRERATDRRKVEEDITDNILERTERELRRAYATIDRKDLKLKRFAKWAYDNREQFTRLGITPPDVSVEDFEDDEPLTARLDLTNHEDEKAAGKRKQVPQ